MRIETHSAVLTEDLPGIYAFIAREDPRAAERVLAAIGATWDQLILHPGCGVPYPTRIAELQDVRMLTISDFANYLVFYRLEVDAVRVLYVVHGARHLPRLFRSDVRT